MQFHDYLSFWEILKKSGVVQSQLLAMGPAKGLGMVADAITKTDPKDRRDQLASVESLWWAGNRPYYNVYPSVCEMLLDTNLGIPGSLITYPMPTIVIRLPTTIPVSTTRIRSIISCVYSENAMKIHKGYAAWTGNKKDETRLVFILAQIEILEDNLFRIGCIQQKFYLEPDETVEKMLGEHGSKDLWFESGITDVISKEQSQQIQAEALRIAVGVSILANDPNFIQPIVLNRDLLKYKDADEATKKIMEERAVRRQHQRGFSIGKDLEEQLAKEREVSPHLRRPHMALFWTGKGREVPRLQLRRGCIVHPKDITHVPTGYFGPEEPPAESTA